MLKKLLFLAALALFPATAHAQAPNVIPGCVYNATPPTLADKQTVAIQCDVNGKLKTTGGGGGGGSPGGSNTQVQYNNAGSFGSITGATTDGTTLTLVAPVLGAATATSINKVAFTAPATAATLTIANNKTLTANNSLTLAGTDTTTMTFPTTSDTVAGLGTAQTFTKQNTFAAGTITTSQPLTLTQAWNAAGVTFTGLLVNITNTASAAGSPLADFQVGGVSKFSVNAATGAAIFAGNLTVNTTLSVPNGNVLLSSNFNSKYSTGQLVASSVSTYTWTNNTDPTIGTVDLILSRNAAGIVQVGTTAANSLGTVLANTLRTNGFTVAGLPAGVVGDRAYVTDQVAACVAAGAALTGGGAITCPVFRNATVWVGD